MPSRRRSSCSTRTVSLTRSWGHPTAARAHSASRGRWRRGSARSAGGRRSHRFDIALSHASHELPLTARSLHIPSAYAFDFEYARVQHTLGSRAATRVVVPDVIPQERLDRLGARRAKTRRYPGLKEDYYLSGFVPDEAVHGALGPRP